MKRMQMDFSQQAEDEEPASNTPTPRIVIRDIRVPDAMYNKNPAQLLINPPKLPILKY